MPLIAPTEQTSAAAALVRAGLADDADAGVLILRQNAADAEALTIAVTSLAVRVLLAACGYDVAKALSVIDGWMAQAAARARAVPP